MSNDSRPVDLFSDSKGVYGIGMVDADVDHKPLILRPDVIRESATFPNKYRTTVLQMLWNRCYIRWSYEFKLHEVMLDKALERNPRYQKHLNPNIVSVGGNTSDNS
jgi:hypothetical protein